MIVRALLTVVAIALAYPTAAAEATAPAKTGTKASAEKGKPAASGKKAAPAPEAKKPAAAITATPAQLAAVMRAKRTLRYAADSCARPGKCDEVLRDEAKSTFMDACRACAAEDLCEQERDAILNGTAKGSKNPCMP